MVVGRNHSQPGLNVTTTLDQFGRVKEQDWNVGIATISDNNYLYDDDSNVLSKYDSKQSVAGQAGRRRVG